MTGGALACAREHQQSILNEEGVARFRFKLAPDLMRAAGELAVLRPFAAGEARDACLAVARAEPVRGRELLNAEDALSGFRELIKRARAHRAQADHDGVEAHGHGTSG